MESPFAAFPPYLRIKDVMDATQFSRSSIWMLLKEAEKTPGIVYRRGEKTVRIARDPFFEWFASHQNMPHTKEHIRRSYGEKGA